MKTLLLFSSGLLFFSAHQAYANWFWWMGPQSSTQPPSQSSYQSKKDFGFAELKQLIEGKQISSIEDLLPHLPESLRSNFTLMAESESAQGATPDNPRVILFGNDARTVLAFNGDPSQAGHNKLEVIEFKDDTREFEFRSITFPDSKSHNKNVEFSEKNPKACLGCHGGEDPRPNWARYPKWKTANSRPYGHFDDNLTSDHDEFIKFLAKKDESPIYRHLIFEGSKINPYSPYAGPSGTAQGTARFRPNMRLTNFFIRQNAQRLMRKLESHPRFDTYQSLILLLREQTHEIFRANNENAKGDLISEQVWALLEKDKLFSHEEISALKKEYIFGSGPKIVDRLLKALGTQYSDWSLKLVPPRGTPDSIANEVSGAYIDGFVPRVFINKAQKGATVDYVENELWKNLTKKDPSFARYYSQHSVRTEIPAVYGSHASGKILDEMGGLIDINRSRGSDKLLFNRLFAESRDASCIKAEVKKSLSNWPY